MIDNNLHHLKMLYFVSLSSLVLCLPLWLFHDAASLLNFDYVSMSLQLINYGNRSRITLLCLYVGDQRPSNKLEPLTHNFWTTLYFSEIFCRSIMKTWKIEILKLPH